MAHYSAAFTNALVYATVDKPRSWAAQLQDDFRIRSMVPDCTPAGSSGICAWLGYLGSFSQRSWEGIVRKAIKRVIAWRPLRWRTSATVARLDETLGDVTCSDDAEPVSPAPLFPCTFCGREDFTSLQGLHRHIASEHGWLHDANYYLHNTPTCLACVWGFRNRRDAVWHLKGARGYMAKARF